MLFLFVGCVVLDFLPFFDFGFLPFAAGCAAGAAGRGFANAGEAVSRNSALAMMATTFRIRVTTHPPKKAQSSPKIGIIFAPVGAGCNRNFAGHRHSITGSGAAEEDVKSTPLI